MDAQAKQRLLVGGTGRVRYAVPLEGVGVILEPDELPARRREVNLPLLFDLEPSPAGEDRYAQVLGTEEPAFLRLGRDVRAVEIPFTQMSTVPEILGTTATRWGWAALALADDGAVVVLDALRLVRIGAPRQGDAVLAHGGPEVRT